MSVTYQVDKLWIDTINSDRETLEDNLLLSSPYPSRYLQINREIIQHHLQTLLKFNRFFSPEVVDAAIDDEEFKNYRHKEGAKFLDLYSDIFNAGRSALDNPRLLTEFINTVREYEEKLAKYIKANVDKFLKFGTDFYDSRIHTHDVKTAIKNGKINNLHCNLILRNSSFIAHHIRELIDDPEFGKNDFVLHYIMEAIPKLDEQFHVGVKISNDLAAVVRYFLFGRNRNVLDNDPSILTNEQIQRLNEYYTETGMCVRNHLDKIKESIIHYNALLDEYRRSDMLIAV